MAPLGRPKRKVHETPPITIPKEMPATPTPTPAQPVRVPERVPVGKGGR